MDIIEHGKDLLRLAEKYRQTPLYEKILEYQEQAMQLSTRLSETHQELLSAKVRVRELEEALSNRAELVWRSSAYWRKDGDGPFCPGCWDGRKQLSRIVKLPDLSWMSQCPVCKSTFEAE
jgi:hypothetical protein